jgi:hypothetical protein
MIQLKNPIGKIQEGSKLYLQHSVELSGGRR